MPNTIVLADDEDDLRAVYVPLLRALGHTVWEASRGEDAVALVLEHRPEMLILDVWMPEMNGFEVLERLRHEPASASMKVVMLSNMSDADTRLECFEMGVTEYLVKGMPLVEFRDRIGQLLEPGPLS
ncbi:response regulator [Tundrisphaera sp. TA3]|uniref:response regulator n=1 Tax=Tundrisphaera sp. TA3 TaxID=3435775 RepID=UPI003EB79A81